MANKASESGQPTLQRGKACLRCRKRKMRCDGTKPACQQCVRAKKGDACEYDDGKGKTRTQLLRENIARLEQRIRELEDPEYVNPAVVLYDPHPHPHSRSGSSSSSFSSPGDNSMYASHSPLSFPSDSSPTSPNTSWTSLQPVASPSPSPFVPEIFFDERQTRFQPPIELARMLLDILSPHRRQCGLDIHMGRLMDSLTTPPEEQRHPALLNAMYLWACFISRPEPLCQHEDHYLGLALDALRDGLRDGEKIVDIIQGSCLLSMYFLANGRILEGSYHATGAAALAVQCGLHLNTHQEQSWPADPQEPYDLKPSRTGVKEGERILAFWQVYNLDRCWSVVLRKPSLIPDGLDPRQSISCPWPQDWAEYEAGHINVEASRQTIKGFMDGQVSPSSFSTQASRVKASALFARADEISTSWDPRMKQPSTCMQEVRALETTIAQFITTLMPLDQLDTASHEDKHTLLAAHTLAHTASIQLYRPFMQDDPVMFDKCARAARACVSVIKHISERDFNFLDPIIGPCWSYAADTLIMELETQEAAWTLVDTDVRNQITTLLYAMTTLSPRLPVVAIAAAKVQKRLAEL
ncbi:putative fungal specific transcription factor [Lyophyllum shimeji]|uniref:Fungal specific transcription factor n=1 Tax=Lyophyllum shimeji TaxID=47721 RepID=A0A9P3ULU5_LYOSH|nr:putative fungal specific transcription factor [Lyophyllum shimeji]